MRVWCGGGGWVAGGFMMQSSCPPTPLCQCKPATQQPRTVCRALNRRRHRVHAAVHRRRHRRQAVVVAVVAASVSPPAATCCRFVCCCSNPGCRALAVAAVAATPPPGGGVGGVEQIKLGLKPATQPQPIAALAQRSQHALERCARVICPCSACPGSGFGWCVCVCVARMRVRAFAAQGRIQRALARSPDSSQVKLDSAIAWLGRHGRQRGMAASGSMLTSPTALRPEPGATVSACCCTPMHELLTRTPCRRTVSQACVGTTLSSERVES